MDPAIVAAPIAVPGSFIGSSLGVIITSRHAVRTQQWDLIKGAIKDLHGADVKLAKEGAEHLRIILKHEPLKESQRQWIRASLTTYIANLPPAPPLGSVGDKVT